MVKLDISRDDYYVTDHFESSVEVEWSLETDGNINLDFVDVKVIIDEFQAHQLMQKLTTLFNYRLVDLDA